MEEGPVKADAVGLYVHFPFCRSKCPCCHFASVPFDAGLASLWWEGLAREADPGADLEKTIASARDRRLPEFRRRFGVDILEACDGEVGEFAAEDWPDIGAGWRRIPEEELFVSNRVLAVFV